MMPECCCLLLGGDDAFMQGSHLWSIRGALLPTSLASFSVLFRISNDAKYP